MIRLFKLGSIMLPMFLFGCFGKSAPTESSLLVGHAHICQKGGAIGLASQWTFDNRGHTASFTIHGVDLHQASEKAGFFLILEDGYEIQLDHIEAEGNSIKVSQAGQAPKFTFLINNYAHHLSIHLTDIEPKFDLEEFLDTSLAIRFQTQEPIGNKLLDDQVYYSADNLNHELRWRHLWTDYETESLGGAALYNHSESTQPNELDSAVVSIWINEGFPLPAHQGCWDETLALEWITAYQTRYQKVSKRLKQTRVKPYPYEFMAFTRAEEQADLNISQVDEAQEVSSTSAQPE